MELLIVQDALENGFGGRVVVQHVPVGGEVTGRPLFRQVQEGEEGVFGLGADAHVVQPAFPRGEPGALHAHRRLGGALGQQGDAAASKQLGVPLLVGGVHQVEPAEQGVGRQLCGPGDVAAAIGLDS